MPKYAISNLLVILCLWLPLSFAAAGAETETGSDASQNPCCFGQKLAPISQVGMYIDGYHVYQSERGLPSEKQHQVREAHYCKQINADMFQCLIYDSNLPEAKVIGIEYVITDKLFKTLPAEEKKLWHPHDAEVSYGLLSLPGAPKDKESEILSFLKTTHGKTWQVWPNLTAAVPLGKPVLMWSVDPKKINSSTKRSVAARQSDPAF